MKPTMLRDYQQEIVFRVHEAWKCHRSVMVQMPTGTGKTHVLAQIVNEKLRIENEESLCGTKQPTNILIVAHRIELIEQIKNVLHHSSLFTFYSSLIKVESIQTISRRIDSIDYSPDVVIIDEAHHAQAKTYRMLWEKWPNAKFLGLTATPCRMNHCGFTDLFDTLVCSWSIAEFIRKGVLSAFDYVSIRPDSMEQRLIDSLEKRGADGDYQIKEMNEVLNRRPSIERLYRSIREFADGKKGIVYAISIDHARKIAEYYCQRGIMATAIDSKTPKEVRKQTVEDFKAGRIQVMVNVDVFSEGFDCPDVEFVQMARPTLSLSKYLQQVGRGLRRSTGKEFCTMIDNVGLCRVFGLPVLAWDWERMFRGEIAGKGNKAPSNSPKGGESKEARFEVQGSRPPSILPKEGRAKTKHFQSPLLWGGIGRGFTNSLLFQPLYETDLGVGLVISHETLLERLNELDVRPETEEKCGELKGWMDEDTGLWGLKRGRRKVTEAKYITVFDTKEEMAAVRFENYSCGLVNDEGKILWFQKEGVSMRFGRNRMLEIEVTGGKKKYLDLCNLHIYDCQPEVKRYGGFELLKVKDRCFSRTRSVYASKGTYESLRIFNMGFLLRIQEETGDTYCILKGENEEYYRYERRLADKGVVVSDMQGKLYRITTEGEKMDIGNDNLGDSQETVARLAKRVREEQHANDERKRNNILNDYEQAVPYKAGMKWGLKVGNHITVPPIYRQIAAPIGRYCAVEKNYCQWGIIAIDGTILIEPKYSKVSIGQDGTAMLTQVTGKETMVKLK